MPSTWTCTSPLRSASASAPKTSDRSTLSNGVESACTRSRETATSIASKSCTSTCTVWSVALVPDNISDRGLLQLLSVHSPPVTYESKVTGERSCGFVNRSVRAADESSRGTRVWPEARILVFPVWESTRRSMADAPSAWSSKATPAKQQRAMPSLEW
eukprot:jgi/Phyca11/566875/estExt2_Genewise1.C_PHYCAscaffold_230024